MMKKIVVVGMYMDGKRAFGASDGGVAYGDRLLSPEILLRRKFEKEGYSFFSESKLPMEQADIVLCSDLTPALYERIRELPPGIFKILSACESAIYAPLSHSPEVLMDPLWDAVMTWNRGFEADHVIHCDIAIAGRTASDLPERLEEWNAEFRERGVVVASNKGPDHRGFIPERNAFYQKLAREGLIDLYGHGWRLDSTDGRLGKIDDKIKIMKRYSYALVIENMWTSGYVTEKLADCILAGIPVIYMGDSWHANRRFPGTFVELGEMTVNAFVECREKIRRDYRLFHQAVKESYKNSNSWCDSSAAAIAECLKRYDSRSAGNRKSAAPGEASGSLNE